MYQDNPWTNTTQSSTQWTRKEDKLFEQALVIVPENLPDRWLLIAEQVPGKSPRDVRDHYEALVHDLREIDSGRVELPNYADDSVIGVSDWDSESQISFGSKSKHADAERKKGTPWTEEEHRLFLIGLKAFGRGDWRSISRNVVITRTPTQVASHAQKFYLRQNAVKKERKRSSIHDITTVDTHSNTVTPPADPKWTYQATDPSGLQQSNPPANFPEEEGSLGYQNFGFPM